MEQGWVYGFAVQREEDGSYHAYSATAPEAIAWGETHDQAIREMASALTEAVRGRMKLGLDLVPPAPAGSDETETFVLPAALAAKATVYAAWKASDMSKVALAAKLACTEKEVRRILDPGHPTGLERMDQAARALGVDLLIGARPVQLLAA